MDQVLQKEPSAIYCFYRITIEGVHVAPIAHLGLRVAALEARTRLPETGRRLTRSGPLSRGPRPSVYIESYA